MIVFAGRGGWLLKYVGGPPPPPPCWWGAAPKLLKMDSGARGGGYLERARRCVGDTSAVVVADGRGRRR